MLERQRKSRHNKSIGGVELEFRYWKCLNSLSVFGLHSHLTQIQQPDWSCGLMKATRMSLSKCSRSLNIADGINNL